MPYPAHLILRISAVASSLLLLAGLIAYQTGYLTPPNVMTHDQLNVSLNLNSIGSGTTHSTTQIEQTAFSMVEQSNLLVAEPSQVATSGDDRQESGVILQTEPFAAPQNMTRETLDELRRRPGHASPLLIQHDALTLMSSSKSIVILPKTPADEQKAIDRFKALAAKCFAERDRNGDKKLSEAELGYHNWQRFVEQDAVKNGAVDSEGFLKNFAWYAQQK